MPLPTEIWMTILDFLPAKYTITLSGLIHLPPHFIQAKQSLMQQEKWCSLPLPSMEDVVCVCGPYDHFRYLEMLSSISFPCARMNSPQVYPPLNNQVSPPPASTRYCCIIL